MFWCKGRVGGGVGGGVGDVLEITPPPYPFFPLHAQPSTVTKSKMAAQYKKAHSCTQNMAPLKPIQLAQCIVLVWYCLILVHTVSTSEDRESKYKCLYAFFDHTETPRAYTCTNIIPVTNIIILHW